MLENNCSLMESLREWTIFPQGGNNAAYKVPLNSKEEEK